MPNLMYFIASDGSKRICMGYDISAGSPWTGSTKLIAMEGIVVTAPADFRFFNRLVSTSPDSLVAYDNYKDLTWTADLIGDGGNPTVIDGENNIFCWKQSPTPGASDTSFRAYDPSDGTETDFSLNDIFSLLSSTLYNSSVATVTQFISHTNDSGAKFTEVDQGVVYVVAVGYAASGISGTEHILGHTYWSAGTLQHDFVLISRNIIDGTTYVNTAPMLTGAASAYANRTNIVVTGSWADERDSGGYTGQAFRSVVFSIAGSIVNDRTSISWAASPITFSNNYTRSFTSYYDDIFDSISDPFSDFRLVEWFTLGDGRHFTKGLKVSTSLHYVRLYDAGASLIDEYLIDDYYDDFEFFTSLFGWHTIPPSDGDGVEYIDAIHAVDFGRTLLPVGQMVARGNKFAELVAI